MTKVIDFYKFLCASRAQRRDCAIVQGLVIFNIKLTFWNEIKIFFEKVILLYKYFFKETDNNYNFFFSTLSFFQRFVFLKAYKNFKKDMKLRSIFEWLKLPQIPCKFTTQKVTRYIKGEIVWIRNGAHYFKGIHLRKIRGEIPFHFYFLN